MSKAEHGIGGTALVSSALFFLVASFSAQAAEATGEASGEAYVPPPGAHWARRSPGDAGLNPKRLGEAISFAKTHETQLPEDLAGIASARDLGLVIAIGGAGGAGEPYNSPIGPVKARGGPAGVILRHGFLVAEWGDTARVDMTFSVSKTFLSSVAGVAWDKGLIRDIHGKAGETVAIEQFASPHNAKITWDHLLRQTSEWQGTLWGKPAWADRPGEKPWLELARTPTEPGSRWKYNDVRVNVLALALLHVWRRPLPEVLKEHVMDPIGASDTWVWHGYDNSWVNIDGKRIQSVAGGGHWGGGMFISALDQARLGLLGLRRGRWGDRQVLSEDWVNMALTPTTGRDGYGFMNWFLNTGKKLMPAAPETAFSFLGSGANIVYMDPENDLVAVVRWLDRTQISEFVRLLLEALE